MGRQRLELSEVSGSTEPPKRGVGWDRRAQLLCARPASQQDPRRQGASEPGWVLASFGVAR